MPTSGGKCGILSPRMRRTRLSGRHHGLRRARARMPDRKLKMMGFDVAGWSQNRKTVAGHRNFRGGGRARRVPRRAPIFSWCSCRTRRRRPASSTVPSSQSCRGKGRSARRSSSTPGAASCRSRRTSSRASIRGALRRIAGRVRTGAVAGRKRFVEHSPMSM